MGYYLQTNAIDYELLILFFMILTAPRMRDSFETRCVQNMHPNTSRPNTCRSTTLTCLFVSSLTSPRVLNQIEFQAPLLLRGGSEGGGRSHLLLVKVTDYSPACSLEKRQFCV